MKITDIRTLSLSHPHDAAHQWYSATFYVEKADCPIVIIETDSKLQGIAEPSTYGDPPEIAKHIDTLKPQLIGRDPLDPDLIPPKPPGDRALHIVYAGLELAQWDLRAKAQDKRVADLIIPLITPDDPDRAPRKTLRIYASGGVQYDWDERPEAVVDEAISLADRGFSAYKMRLGTEWSWSGVTVGQMIDLLRKVTAAVGDRMDLMLEGNCRLDEDQAFEIGRYLDAAGWTWFEEPLPKDQIDGYARLNAGLDIPITGGESNSTLDQFIPFFEKRAYAKGQLDVGVCTLAEAIRIYHAAKDCGIDLFTQNWHNGLLTVHNAHFLAALPAEHVLEMFIGQGPLQWEILKNPPETEGYLRLPDGPGWGVELADDLEARFPHIPGPWGRAVER